jgi:ubiquitin carboxyl-terminal hydrolase 36/42
MHPSGADSSRPNYLVDLFQGRLLSRVYCSECGGVSSTVDATQGLELEVGRAATLQAALAEFCRSERLEERLGNAYHCERCRGLTSAEKCLRLSSVPDVLRIQVCVHKFRVVLA